MDRPARRTPAQKRWATVRAALLFVLGCVVIIAVGLRLEERAAKSRAPLEPPPPSLEDLLPVDAVDQLGADGFVLHVRAGWSAPTSASAVDTLCGRLRTRLEAGPRASVDFVGVEGEDLGRCAPAP